MTLTQPPVRQINDAIVFTSGRLKGQTGTVVDVRHEGHHLRVTLTDGRTISTRPGAVVTDPVAVWRRLQADTVMDAPFDATLTTEDR